MDKNLCITFYCYTLVQVIASTPVFCASCTKLSISFHFVNSVVNMVITYVGILPTHTHSSTWLNHGSIWEIMYCIEGSGSLITGGEELPFCAGDIIIQPPDILHAFSTDTTGTMLYIMVDGEYPFGRMLLLHDTADRDIYSLATVLCRVYNHSEPRHQTVALHVLSALIEYLTMIGSKSQHSVMVESMENTIIKNVSSSTFRIQDMYRQLYLPEDKARAQFESEIGCTPHKYLSRLRIQQACWLLTHTPGDTSIAETASRVGIPDPQYFSRIFKQHTGLSPTEWLKQNGGKD